MSPVVCEGINCDWVSSMVQVSRKINKKSFKQTPNWATQQQHNDWLDWEHLCGELTELSSPLIKKIIIISRTNKTSPDSILLVAPRVLNLKKTPTCVVLSQMSSPAASVVGRTLRALVYVTTAKQHIQYGWLSCCKANAVETLPTLPPVRTGTPLDVRLYSMLGCKRALCLKARIMMLEVSTNIIHLPENK